MKLIEIYIHEVTRRLPEQNREDIALELRSTIEDMLPDDYDEKEVKAVLEKLGNPAILASEYRDQPMYLIAISTLFRFICYVIKNDYTNRCSCFFNRSGC